MELLKSNRFLALRCAIVTGGGLALGLLLPIPWWIGLIAAGLSMIGMILLSEKFLYLTLLALTFSYGKVSLPPDIPNGIYDSQITIRGELIGKTGSYSIVRMVEPEILRGRKVLIYLLKDEDAGTRLKIKGTLEKLSFPHNPGVFNRNIRLRREGVIGRISDGNVSKLSPPRGLRKWLNDTRKVIIERNRILFGKKAALYTAILLGERSEVPEEVYADMKRTGTLHLLAVSGLHVGVLVAFVFLVLRLSRAPRWLTLPLLAVVLVFYIGLVDPRPSIIRASVMSIAVAAGFTFERKILPLNSLAVAALVVLLLKPVEILTAGFQLSFAAALGIILAAQAVREILYDSVQRKKPRDQKGKRGSLPKPIVRWIILPLALSAAATLATMPILAAHFHEITFGPLLANLPLILLVSLLLPLGLISILLSFIWLPLGKIAGFAVSGMIWAIERLLQLFPGRLLFTETWPTGLSAGIYLGGLLFHTEKNKPRRLVSVLGILLIGANLGFWPWAFKTNRPVLSMIDTYHGNVALLESNGRIVLINPGSKAEHTVSDYIKSKGINRIDYVLFLSTKQGDISGLDEIQARFRVGTVLEPENKKGYVRLPSCNIHYDLTRTDKPFYSIESTRKKVTFISNMMDFDKASDYYYPLHDCIHIDDYPGIIITKDSLRKDGGFVLKL